MHISRRFLVGCLVVFGVYHAVVVTLVLHKTVNILNPNDLDDVPTVAQLFGSSDSSLAPHGGEVDVPYPHIPPEPPINKNQFLLVGIITMAEKIERRAMIRATYMSQMPPNVTVRFILGKPKNQFTKFIELENSVHKDIIILDMHENMNDGKTYEYYKHIYKSGFRFEYVLKGDDDAYFNLENLKNALMSHADKPRLYYGFGIKRPQDKYTWMAGMGYTVSWEVVEWIANTDYCNTYKVGLEDQTTAKWFWDTGYYHNMTVVSDTYLLHDAPSHGGKFAHKVLPDSIVIHQAKTVNNFFALSDVFFRNFTYKRDGV